MPNHLQVFQALGPAALAKAASKNHIIILVDVLRASSTIITALAHGAECVIPVPTVDEARRLASRIPQAILAGERNTHPPPGFHLGNSPQSFTIPQIRGRPIILTTTNFTRTLGNPPPKATILTAAILNLDHAAQTARHLYHQTPRPITIISAGNPDGPSAEDEMASHHLALRILHPHDPPGLAHPYDIANELLTTRHGARLVQAGYEEDIHFCAQLNRYPLTPILRNGAFQPYKTSQQDP